nr:unnamed protein product [Callosobruchus analis]
MLLEKIAHSASPTTSDTVKEVPLTYSQAVKKENVKKSTSVLIIRSKDEKESNFDVMKNIKGKINPATDKIGVNYTKLIKNGMLVNCTDDDSLQKLKGAVASKFERKYEILTPKPLRPRLIIPDVDKSVQSKEEFMQHIEQGNPILSASDIKVTNDISQYCAAKVFSSIGKKTPIAVRFSTVGGESGSADTVRDPRGFAVKFYTEDGIWDLVGNNTPIFFIRDPVLFPSFIHTQKRNPQTHLKDPNMFWDFISLRPEITHQVMFLFSDRGK